MSVCFENICEHMRTHISTCVHTSAHVHQKPTLRQVEAHALLTHINTCAHTYQHMCTHISTCTRISTHVYTRINVHSHINTRAHTYPHTCIHTSLAHTHINTRAHTYQHTSTHTSAHVHTHINTPAHTHQNMYTLCHQKPTLQEEEADALLTLNPTASFLAGRFFSLLYLSRVFLPYLSFSLCLVIAFPNTLLFPSAFSFSPPHPPLPPPLARSLSLSLSAPKYLHFPLFLSVTVFLPYDMIRRVACRCDVDVKSM